MMTDYNSMNQGMMGGNGGLTMIFMWSTYLLFLAVLVLSIAALLKYINKK